MFLSSYFGFNCPIFVSFFLLLTVWSFFPTFLSLMLWYLLIYTLFIDILEWAHNSTWKSTVHTSVQLLVQWLHAGSLKLAMAGVIYITETGKCHKSGCYFQRENYCTLTSSPLFLSFSGYDKKNYYFYRFLTKSKIKYLEFLLNNTKF